MMTPSQRAAVAVRESLKLFEAEAKERQRSGRQRRLDKDELGRATAAAAARHEVGARTVERAKRVFAERPDLAARVVTGELTVKRAETIMRRGAAETLKERVYFIQAENGLIKIGRATSPEDRLESFQIGCPLRLELLGSYEPKDAVAEETRLHRLLAHDRQIGEWFRPSEVLLAVLAFEGIEVRR